MPLRTLLSVAILLAVPALVRGQEVPLKVEALAEAPPAELEAPVKEALAPEGVRVLDGQGKPFADIWLRAAVPATGAPAGPEGAILFPVLEVGQVVGVVRFAQESGDYRNQPIVPGIYTMRYGRQPVDGDHLGVSTHRDYLMLVPAQDELDSEPVDQETLNIISADAAQTNHPAVFLLLAPPEGAPDGPSVAQDEANSRWGVVLPLALKVQGQEDSVPLKVQLVLVGTGPV